MTTEITTRAKRIGLNVGTRLSYQVPPQWLLAILVGYLSLDQILLWRFLDIAPAWAYLLGIGGSSALILCILRVMRSTEISEPAGPTVRTLLACFGVALVLFILGGEGRFFYANIDWQVRNAVLRDIGTNPWPFVYTARAAPDVLRAPIGMFLVPGLAIKAFGLRAGDIVLLLQNSAFLTIVLGLSVQLFADPAKRVIALLIFIAFSGLDGVGRFFIHRSFTDHIESWANIQYSSNITLAFWVPQHALAGWIAALSFLLWRAGQLPLGIFLALLPLTALWSPFAVLGIAPFAAIAGLTALVRREITWLDVALPALASAICIPCLLYLTAAGDEVGLRPYAVSGVRYLIFQTVETVPYLVPLIFVILRNRKHLATLVVVAICLLSMPFIQIGWSIDFMMRASIPALFILAVTVADVILDGTDPENNFARGCLTVAVILGSATGFFEIRRAFQHPSAPRVVCTFFKAWDQSFAPFPKGSYLAPLSEMPAIVKPVHPARVRAAEPEKCWAGDWYRPSGV